MRRIKAHLCSSKPVRYDSTINSFFAPMVDGLQLPSLFKSVLRFLTDRDFKEFTFRQQKVILQKFVKVFINLAPQLNNLSHFYGGEKGLVIFLNKAFNM